MSNVIIDTNIMVIANRQNRDVAVSCMDACVKFLIRAQASSTVLMDSGDEIRAEYTRALRVGTPPQLGAQFLIHIYREQWNSQFVRHVELEKSVEGEFADFPNAPEIAGFDRSDRKFAALARRTGTPVSNAVDSDWIDYRDHLDAHGISVDFICGCDESQWFNR